MTFDILKEIFTSVMPQMDASKVTMDSVLTSDLGVDSLNMLLLSISVEERFGIKFDMNAKLDTVRDIVEYVDAHKN